MSAGDAGDYDGSTLGLRSTSHDGAAQKDGYIEWANNVLSARDLSVSGVESFADDPRLFIQLAEILSGETCAKSVCCRCCC
jgi:hypothetical protein